jgi:hypothetical protein
MRPLAAGRKEGRMLAGSPIPSAIPITSISPAAFPPEAINALGLAGFLWPMLAGFPLAG